MSVDPSSVDPNLVARIQAMLNVNGRTPEEAAAFLAKAHQLLAQHNLDMDEVTKVGGVTRKAVINERTIIIDGNYNWKKILLGGVADFFFCKSVIVTGTSTVVVIGRADNREATYRLYRWIITQLDNMAVRATARYQPIRRTDPSKQRWRNNYLHGAVQTVAERLLAMKKQTEDDAKAQTTSLAIRTQALVVQTRQENDEFFTEMLKEKGLVRKSVKLGVNRSREGLDAGKAAGHTVDLNGPGRHITKPSSGASQFSLTGPR